ncbi:MAG TPA: hypothetical protein VH502_13440 [Actinoplanes sp.]
MAVESATRDDRVLPLTRVVAYAIVPFLLVAFAVLYPVPGDTGRLFAWHIASPLTAMLLGSAYLGGAYFFLRAARAPAWHTIKGGFVPVGIFATLLGVATVLHWPVFTHRHVAFWLWVLLYFTTPFLIFGVWLRNRRYDRPADGGDTLLPSAAAWAIATIGGLALTTGAVLFLAPGTVAPWWPWMATPLTAQVLGAILCLGAAGIGAPADRRWSTVRLPVQVALIMLALMLVAGLRAWDEFAATGATWVFAIGFSTVTLALALLYLRMERR